MHGDSATVVVGIIGGMGLDNISSVSVGKFHDNLLNMLMIRTLTYLLLLLLLL